MMGCVSKLYLTSGSKLMKIIKPNDYLIESFIHMLCLAEICLTD